MNVVARRKKRFESAVSICLLLILLLIAAGVLVKKFSYGASRFDKVAATTQPSLQSSQTNNGQNAALSFLTPAGFETLSKLQAYTPEYLYEKINGKAPFYLEAGFEKLFTQQFVSNADDSLWFELFVYDMADIRNAFSVYSTQRRTDANVTELFPPAFGYRTTNALYFIHGQYYIELAGSSESEELIKAIIKTAGKVQENLAVGSSEIAELELFPKQALVPASFKLYLTSAFGFEGLTDIVTAKYQLNGETITAFLGKRTEETEALKDSMLYYEFLLNNGGVNIPTTNREAKLVDFYGTTEIVASVGPFLFGIHEAQDRDNAEKLAEVFIKKLEGADN